MTSADLGNVLVVTGIGTVQVFDGSYPPTDAYEVSLLNLGNGEELNLPVTHEQAEEIFSLYLSALGTDAEDAETPSKEEGLAPITRATAGHDNENPSVPKDAGRTLTAVQEF